MFYKVEYNGKTIDLLENPIYVKYQKKHDIEHAESHSKSHIKPHHRVSPFIGQMCFLFFLFYPIAAEMSINFRLRGEKYPAT